MWEKPENVELINHEMNKEEKQDFKKENSSYIVFFKVACQIFTMYMY